MRKELQVLNGERLRFRARVAKFSTKSGYKGRIEKTLLLKDIYLVKSNQLVTDHLWMTMGATLTALDLKVGDILEFDSRITPYLKGYVNRPEQIDYRKTDYRLSWPTKLIKF